LQLLYQWASMSASVTRRGSLASNSGRAALFLRQGSPWRGTDIPELLALRKRARL